MGIPNVATGAAADVLAERRRQIEAEGFTPDHDAAQRCTGELARAAACYALGLPPTTAEPLYGTRALSIWPLGASAWKPRSRRENLVRAGALILAEIERIDRAAAGGGGVMASSKALGAASPGFRSEQLLAARKNIESMARLIDMNVVFVVDPDGSRTAFTPQAASELRWVAAVAWACGEGGST